MSLVLQRFLQRVDCFASRIEQARGIAPSNTRVTYLKNLESKPERKIPLFGGEAGAFGEDYITYKVPRPEPFGPQPLENKENFHGHVNYGSPAPMPTEKPYEDPAISRSFKRTSEETDQKAPPAHNFTPADKPITLSVEKKKDFQAERGKKEPTPADLHAIDLKKAPYDFSF